MEFIFQLLAQLFGNVEDAIVPSSEHSSEKGIHAEEIAHYKSELEEASIPNPEFLSGFEFH